MDAWHRQFLEDARTEVTSRDGDLVTIRARHLPTGEKMTVTGYREHPVRCSALAQLADMVAAAERRQRGVEAVMRTVEQEDAAP